LGFAQLIRGDQALWALAIVGAGHQCLLGVVTNEDSQNCNVFTDLQVSFLILFWIIFFILFHYFALSS
jgi:hypothetical protein